MPNKTRLIILGVVVLIFLVGNFIAGYYKWGASDQTSNQQMLKEDTVEAISDQKKQSNKQITELDASKKSEQVENTSSGETIADSVKTDYKTEIASLKSENKYLRSVQQTGSDVEAENIKLREQLEAATTTNQALEKEFAALRSELNDKQTLINQNKQLSEQVQQYSAASERLQKEMSEMQSSIGKYRELAANNEQLSDQVQECSDTSKNLENEISKLQIRVDKYQNAAGEYKQLQAKLEASTREIEALKARLDKIRAIVASDEKSN